MLQQTADPWPAYSWEELEQAIQRERARLKWAWAPMQRRLPAWEWVHACEVQTRVLSRYPYCRLATIPYDEMIRHSPIYERAPKLPIHTPDPRGRVLQRVHRLLDKLIAWRRGWRRFDAIAVSSGKSHPLFS